MEPGHVRALDKGTALLLATGVPVALLRLRPWYLGPNARRINKDTQRAADAIASRARNDLHDGPRIVTGERDGGS
jgi:hypothetical protein